MPCIPCHIYTIPSTVCDVTFPRTRRVPHAAAALLLKPHWLALMDWRPLLVSTLHTHRWAIPRTEGKEQPIGE
ncbi:hypothetical protein FKM82_029893 [Ascaphus truei]